jgi:type II secretory pathway pseudopilin PulG
MVRRWRPGNDMGRSPQRQLGFTYIGLLIAVVILGLMLTAVGRIWTTTEQRERETQLLFAGHAYRLAISSFFAHGHRFPVTLQELLQDERYPVPHHHLRRLYPDPMTGKADWVLVLTPDGQGIMGVASSSTATPIKHGNFDLIDEVFTDTDCYCDWKFVYFPNRFMRTTGPTGSAVLAPSNTNSQPPAAVGSFSPGSVSTLPTGGSSPTPFNSNPGQAADSN